jgi:hypothetical protein
MEKTPQKKTLNFAARRNSKHLRTNGRCMGRFGVKSANAMMRLGTDTAEQSSDLVLAAMTCRPHWPSKDDDTYPSSDPSMGPLSVNLDRVVIVSFDRPHFLRSCRHKHIRGASKALLVPLEWFEKQYDLRKVNESKCTAECHLASGAYELLTARLAECMSRIAHTAHVAAKQSHDSPCQ